MSVVKKTAKFSLILLGLFAMLVVVVGGYMYMNRDALAKDFAEKAASHALGVPVTIGEVQILLDQLRVEVSDIAIANPPGYSKPHAITVKRVNIAAESFSTNPITFSNIDVDGTQVNLEVNQKGPNLGYLKKTAEARSETGASASPSKTEAKANMKVIVREFTLTGAQLNPAVTLLQNQDLSPVKVADIRLNGIGEKENGVLVEEAIAQIMDSVLEQFNESANSAGFLEGLSLDMLNDIGVSTGEVFKKNLKKSYDKEVDKFKQGIDGLKNMFE